MTKNIRNLNEKNLEKLRCLYAEYIKNHYLRITNNKPFERQESSFVIERRSRDYADLKMSEIFDRDRIVLVTDSIEGFIECQLNGSVAQIWHVFTTYTGRNDERSITLNLFRDLTDILKRLGISKVMAMSHVEDEEFNRTLCALMFELTIGAATITSERTI